jgi:hypothetical protein
MKTITFNLNELEQMCSNGFIDPLNTVFKCMIHEIENGNVVILKKDNQGDSPVLFFHEKSALKNFYNEFSRKNQPSLKVLLEMKKQRSNMN